MVARRSLMKVRDIMTEPPLTCTPETSVAVAARRMREADYGTLPVLDSRGRLVGIVTDRDICLVMAGTNRNALNVAVREAMTRKVVSVLPDDDVHDALVKMKAFRVRRLPVRDAFGRLSGILSIEDVVVRGLEGDGIAANEIVETLRAMYVRLPAAVEATSQKNEFTPG
jgi:CBS domain-containing protein